MEKDDIAIEPISVEDLRADKAVTLIEPIASLAYRAFRESPWNDNSLVPRFQARSSDGRRSVLLHSDQSPEVTLALPAIVE